MFEFLEQYSWMQEVYFGNALSLYVESLIVFVGLFLVFEIFQKFVLLYLERLTRKTETDLDDILIDTIKSIKPVFYWLLSFYFVLQYLDFGPEFDKYLNIGLLVLIVVQVISAINKFIESFTKSKAIRTNKNQTSLHALSIFMKVTVWVIGTVFLLSNLGVNVSSLVAGLGIGGIAVALAVQNVLEDLFSSFVIYFDKPFKIGDYISVGEHEGNVEKIGIKTTRLRALEGEEVVISNKELTSTRVQNYRLLKVRRVEIEFGVAYETPKAKLEKVPSMIEEIVNSVEGVEFIWSYIDRFDDSAVTFIAVYNVNSKEFVDYMKANHEIHIGIMAAFKKAKIDIPYPTRTLKK